MPPAVAVKFPVFVSMLAPELPMEPEEDDIVTEPPEITALFASVILPVPLADRRTLVVPVTLPLTLMLPLFVSWNVPPEVDPERDTFWLSFK